MKVLVVEPGADFSVQDVNNGLVKGLKACGAEVGVLNLSDRLSFYSAAHLEKNGEWVRALDRDDAIRIAAKGVEVVCYEWWPDIVVIVTGVFIPPELWGILARRPHHVVLWATESPYEDDRQLRPARYADTVIVNDPTNLDQFRDVNPRTWYLPHSYDPDIHHPGKPTRNLACDFGFVGTGFPSRIEFLEEVDWSGIDAKLFGNWSFVQEGSPLEPLLMFARAECFDNRNAAKLYRSAKLSANLYRKEISEQGTADGWAIGPREVELAACETFFLREPRAEGDALFPMLPTFDTPAEFEDLLRWWIAHPEQRSKCAALARGAIADRTFENSARRLLNLVDGVVKVPS